MERREREKRGREMEGKMEENEWRVKREGKGGNRKKRKMGDEEER